MRHSAPPKRKITMDDVVHTGPGTLAGRYLRQFWQPVYRSEDLAPARPKPVKLMSEDFTLYRGESGEAHAVAFRCAHRGTQLSTGWVEGDNLRCFYHGWVYDGSGQCVEQPAEPKPFCQKVRIRGYPVQEYLGLIFVYMGEGEPPSFPRFVELEDFQDGVRFASSIPIQPCNFFNRIDQALDHCHTIFAHRESFVEEGGLEGIPTLSAEETEYGAHLRIVHPNGVEGAGHFQMPNINTFEAAPRWPDTGWTTNVFWRVPIDDEHYGQLGITLVPVRGGEEVKQRVLERVRQQRRVAPGTDLSPEQLGEEILAGRAHWLDFPHRAGFVQVQDYVILRGQGTYAPRHMEHLGREDVGTILVRKLWERELRALADGRPLKQWTRPRLSTQYVGLER
jgi:5,5'-dehydrodivanillate O-demethylase